MLLVLSGAAVMYAGVYLDQKSPLGLANINNPSSSAPSVVNAVATQTPGNFFNSSEMPVPLLFDPFPQETTSTARIIVEDPNVNTNGTGWDAIVSAALKRMRVMRIRVLEVQSPSLQPAVLQERELYVLGDPAYIDGLNLIPGSAEIAELSTCHKDGRPASGGQEGWNFFCAGSITVPQHVKGNFVAPYASWRQTSDGVVGQRLAAAIALMAADWDQASATLSLDLNVQTHAFCPYPWLGIISDEYGDFIPERQAYSTGECLSGPNDRVKIDFDGIPPSRELTIAAFDQNEQQVAFFVLGLSSSSIWTQLEPTD